MVVVILVDTSVARLLRSVQTFVETQTENKDFNQGYFHPSLIFTGKNKTLGPYSEQFIFFITYERAQ